MSSLFFENSVISLVGLVFTSIEFSVSIFPGVFSTIKIFENFHRSPIARIFKNFTFVATWQILEIFPYKINTIFWR